MNTDGVGKDRRRFQAAATTVAGGVGTAYVLAPFVMSIEPSAHVPAAGAPVESDINKLENGHQNMTASLRGEPVRLVNRTAQNLNNLPTLDSRLRAPRCEQQQQPSYSKNECRARRERPHHLVPVGSCTPPGCAPTHRPENAPAVVGPKWQGGFACPRHGSGYDLAGRIFKGVPAPLNPVIPPCSYLSETKILVGEDEKGAA